MGPFFKNFSKKVDPCNISIFSVVYRALMVSIGNPFKWISTRDQAIKILSLNQGPFQNIFHFKQQQNPPNLLVAFDLEDYYMKHQKKTFH